MIPVNVAESKITSNSIEAFSLYEKSRFGEKKEGRIEYSPIEALFLLSERKIAIFSGKKPLTKESFMKKL